MTLKRSGLGRNLTALLGQSSHLSQSETPSPSVLKLSVNCLQPGKYQPRGDIEQVPLEELAASIKQQGVLQPLIVRKLDEDYYEIIAGERRWRASKLAGLKDVPVIVRQVDDETAMAMALVENLQREDLNAMDQARAMERLVSEFALTHQQIAQLLGKSRTAVSNFLRLLTLTMKVKSLLEQGHIDMGHARALLALNEEQQQQAATLIIARQLSVRETEKMAAQIKEGKTHEKEVIAFPFVLHEDLQSLAQQLQTKINITQGKSGKGNIVIQYNSMTNLQDLLQKLNR